MEQQIARIALSGVPYSADKLYSYLVPPELADACRAGVRVSVPFGRGNRRAEGFVLETLCEAADKPLKPVFTVLDKQPLLDASLLRLAKWMKARYFCTVYDALKAKTNDATKLAAVADFDRVLSLSLIEKAEELRKKSAEPEEEHDERIEALLAERAAAKKAKNYAEADRIRDMLAAEGITIIDTPQGAKWKRS